MHRHIAHIKVPVAMVIARHKHGLICCLEGAGAGKVGGLRAIARELVHVVWEAELRRESKVACNFGNFEARRRASGARVGQEGVDVVCG